jgi:hypothetical protein
MTTQALLNMVYSVTTVPGRFEPSDGEVARSGRTPAYHGGM